MFEAVWQWQWCHNMKQLVVQGVGAWCEQWGWQQKVRQWHHTTHHTVLGSTWHMDRVVVVPGNVLMATTTWWWWWWWWQSMPQTNKGML